MENTNIYLFEQYYSHLMQDEDKNKFEQRLKKESDFAQEWHIFNLLIEGIKEIEFKKKMTLIQEEIGVETNGFSESHIEQYIIGKLAPNLKTLLEIKMQLDAKFKEEIEFRKSLINHFKENEAKKDFLARIGKIQAEIKEEDQVVTPTNRIFRLSAYYRPLAAAASILLVIGVGMWWYNNNQKAQQNLAKIEQQKNIVDTIPNPIIETPKDNNKEYVTIGTTIDKTSNISKLIIDAFDYKNPTVIEVNSFADNNNNDTLFRRKILNLLKSSKDVVVFYYSGHGVGLGKKDREVVLNLENIKNEFNTDKKTLKTINDKLDQDVTNEELKLLYDTYSSKINTYKALSDEIDWHIALNDLAIEDDATELQRIAKKEESPYQQKANEILKKIKK